MVFPTARVLLLACLLGACGCSDRPHRPQVPGGDPERGRAAVLRYGCIGCHAMAGLSSTGGANVGPPLTHLAERGYIAGVLPNTPENMVRWLRDPTQVDPRTAMPALGLSAEEAADIAAFLYARD